MTQQAPEYLRAAQEYEDRYGKAEYVQATAKEEAGCYYDSAIKAGYNIEMPLNSVASPTWQLSSLLGDLTKDSALQLLHACHAAVNRQDDAAAEFLRQFVVLQSSDYADNHWECWL